MLPWSDLDARPSLNRRWDEVKRSRTGFTIQFRHSRMRQQGKAAGYCSLAALLYVALAQRSRDI